ncbi:hypothetical protein [Lactiplantibacillus plantarum]|uniref:hypothetical protein n=1 Tax=Lactiplantibacillus plantarum TaxID=1590 RepID=UPI003F533E08
MKAYLLIVNNENVFVYDSAKNAEHDMNAIKHMKVIYNLQKFFDSGKINSLVVRDVRIEELHFQKNTLF